MPNVRLALCQTNPIVGDFSGNTMQILQAVRKARNSGAKVCLFGEMSLCGYPIEDLALNPSFIKRNEEALGDLILALKAENLSEITVVVGLAGMAQTQRNKWAFAQNRAVVIQNDKVIQSYNKHHLPNYSVFDEYRNFVPGDEVSTFEVDGLTFALAICEDIWQAGGPVGRLRESNVDVALVLNGSPFEVDKEDRRLELAKELAERENVAVAYANLVGGQDDLVFDGDSFVVSSKGELIARAVQFEESHCVVDIKSKSQLTSIESETLVRSEELRQIWGALVLGLRDYVNKNRFKSVILGLSGGIDSAVCAAIAVDALGANRVFGVSLPSKFSSDHSKSDAYDLAKRLGINIRSEPIGPAVSIVENQLALDGVASENLQARIRAVVLMALSNADGHLTLTTGNKSELSVGYSTIYGDSAGGFAPIKDVAKTLVWKLAEARNKWAESAGEVPPIPQNSISKPPSAELRPDQVDQDSLPDYETLDAILRLYIEEREDLESIVQAGFDTSVVSKVLRLVDQSEWKRRQGAIGPKITRVSFGKDRRLPITNRFDPRG